MLTISGWGTLWFRLVATLASALFVALSPVVSLSPDVLAFTAATPAGSSASSYDIAATSSSSTPLARSAERAAGIPSSPAAASDGAQPWIVALSRAAAEAATPGTAVVKWGYPTNRGFMGSPVRTTLKPGTVVDRYGADSGRFVSPQGTPFSQRSLMPSSLDKPFHTYEVVNPIDVHAGTIAPWFGRGGGGIQYEFGQSMAELIEGGFLKAVTP